MATLERALLASLQASGAGWWQVDASTGSLTCCDRARELLTGSATSVLDSFSDLLECLHPDDRAALEEPPAATGQASVCRVRAMHPDGAVRWLESSQCLVDGDRFGLLHHLDHGQLIDRTAERVGRRVARVVAPEYFAVLVAELGAQLGVRRAFLAELVHPGGHLARTVASWRDGRETEPFEFDVADGPSGVVLARRECVWTEDAQRDYPQDATLAHLGIRGYVGVPLVDVEGVAVGVLVAMHDGPMPDMDLARSVLTSFSARAGTELGLERARVALAESERRLRDLLDASPFGVHEYALEPDGRLVFMGGNRAAARILGVDHTQFVGRTIEEAFPPLQDGPVPEAYRQVARSGQPYETMQVVYGGGEIRGAYEVAAFATGANRMAALFRDVTERHRAEDALRKSQRMIAHILDSVPQAVFWKDRDSVYVGCNGPFAALAGLADPADIVGMADYDLPWPVHETEAYRADDQEVMSTAQSKRHIVEPLQKADGSRIWIDTTKVPLIDEGGWVYGVLGVFDDITQRREADLALQRAETLSRTIVDTVDALIVVHDRNAAIVRFNAAAERVSGWSAREVIGRQTADVLIPEEDREYYKSNQPGLQAGPWPSRLENRWQTRTGETRWISWTAAPLLDAEGNAEHIIGTGIDFTERREAEQRLRFIEAAVEHSSDCAYWIEPSGRLVFVNEAACRQLGYTRDELLGMCLWDVDVEMTPESWAEDWLVLSAAGSIVAERRHRAKDGRTFPVEARGTYIEFGGQQFNCGFARDITERKQAEEALRESKDRLDESQRVSRMASFVIDLEADTWACSDSMEPVFGVGKDYPRTLESWLAAVYAEDRETVAAEFARVVQDRERFDKEYRAVRPNDGAVRWVHGLGQVVCGDDGRPMRMVGTIQDVTERKLAEEALRESKFWLDESQRVSRMGSYVVDVQTLTWTCSGSLSAVLGIDPARTWSLDDWVALMHPDDRAEVTARYGCGVTERSGFEMEYRIVRPSDNAVLWVHSLGDVACDASGQVLRMFGTIQDITDRKRIELALRESEYWLNESQRVSHLGSYRLDIASGVWTCSASLCALFGIDETFARTIESWIALVHPEDRARMSAYAAGVFATGERWNAEYRIVRQNDGSSRWVLGLGEMGLDVSGRPVQMFGTIQDITERKLAEQAVADSEARFRLLAENSTDLIARHAPDGAYIYVSPACKPLLGYEPDELLGTDPYTLFHPEDLEAIRQSHSDALAGSALSTVRCRIMRKDGAYIWFETTSRSIADPATGAVIELQTASRDITERRSLQEQLVHAQKMESLGRLAGGVAHDFNNLLTAIIGYTDVALATLPRGADAAGYLADVRRAGERAAELTSQLLAFARKQVVAPKVIDVNDAVAETQKVMRRLIGEDIELITVPGPGVGRVRVDPGQFQQVLINIAVNARDAMPGGGRLTIATHRQELDETYARQHEDVAPGVYAAIDLSDTGVGMDEETRERIFDPFFTTKEQGKGTGLGLAMCHGIVKQNGGHIWVYSELGKGTTFRIYLPSVDDGAEGARQAEEPEPAPGSETVLLVEDDEMVRELASRLIESGGYRLLVARDGVDALRVAADYADTIHLLLTDIVMPQMSGRELAEQLSEARPDIKVLYTSGYTEDTIVHMGVVQETVHLLQKPYTRRALLTEVRAVLDSRKG